MTSVERGILAYSAYIPSLRIDRAAILAANAWAFPSRRGKGSRACASWDEDPITMAVEALRGLDKSNVDALTFACTAAPFADPQNATLLSAALGMGPELSTMDVCGSPRAGASALAAALLVADRKTSIVAAADARRAMPGSGQELQYGAGSIAFKIGTGAVIARVIGEASRSDPFFDHFRQSGVSYDYYWEERWVRDEGILKVIPPSVSAVLQQAGVSPKEVKHFCFPTLLAGASAALAKRLGIPNSALADDLMNDCGDTGAAHGLMMLASSLEKAKPGEKILLVSFGAGCEVLLFEATAASLAYRSQASVSAAMNSGRIEPHYTKLLSFQKEIRLDWGMRGEGNEKVSLTQQFRAREQLFSFTAGKCEKCGAIQFPQLASCVNCGSFDRLIPFSLSEEPATVFSFTADWLAYYPSPPLYFGLIQFDNGARVLMEIVDVSPAKLEIGCSVRMVYRVKSHDAERSYSRYFWKAVPVISQEA